MIIDIHTHKKSCKLPMIVPCYKHTNKMISSTRASEIGIPQSRSFSFMAKKTQFSIYSPNQLHIKYKSVLNQKALVEDNLKSLQLRIKTIESLQKIYGIKFSNTQIKNLSIQELENKAKHTFKHKKILQSYNKIAHWWKKILIIKKIQMQQIKCEKAAFFIQTNWRIYLHKIICKNMILKIKLQQNKAALDIQRVFKGYMVRKVYGIILKKIKMSKNFEYFEKIRKKLLKQSLTTISYAWLTYKSRKAFLANRQSLKARKSIIYGILIDGKSTGPTVQRISTEFVTKVQNSSNTKTKSEPDSPTVKYGRFRSGTVDLPIIKPYPIENN
jgi:IQ calmodulin-binding motif